MTASGIERLNTRFAAGIPTTIVMFGDSITWGSRILPRPHPDRDESAIFHTVWHRWLKQQHPGIRLQIVNAGVSGDTVREASARFDTDVISHNPDAVVIEFGINDCWKGPDIQEFRAIFRSLIDRVELLPGCLPIPMTANMLNHSVSDTTLEMSWFADKTAEAQISGQMTEYMNAIRDLSSELDLPIIDGYARWEAARSSGEDTDALLINGANHPGEEGHRLLAEAMAAAHAAFGGHAPESSWSSS